MVVCLGTRMVVGMAIPCWIDIGRARWKSAIAVYVADGASGRAVRLAARCGRVWRSVFAFATQRALSIRSVVREEEGGGVWVGWGRVARGRGLGWVPGGGGRRGGVGSVAVHTYIRSFV